MTKIRIRLGRLAAALAVTALAAGSGFLAAGPASAASTTSYNPIRNASPGTLCLDVMSEDGLHKRTPGCRSTTAPAYRSRSTSSSRPTPDQP